MTTFPRSPRLICGGIALLDVASNKVLRVIALQYNSDTLSRTLQPQAVVGEGGGDRSQSIGGQIAQAVYAGLGVKGHP